MSSTKDFKATDPLKDLTDNELADLLGCYHLYATSGANNPNVVPGPVMLKELKRRLRLKDKT